MRNKRRPLPPDMVPRAELLVRALGSRPSSRRIAGFTVQEYIDDITRTVIEPATTVGNGGDPELYLALHLRLRWYYDRLAGFLWGDVPCAGAR